jgi:phosphomannomutase
MSIKFGTSGLRGLAVDFTPALLRDYVRAFVLRLRELGVDLRKGILLSGDFRESTPRIVAAIEEALRELRIEPITLAPLPSPALAFGCRESDVAGIMVTGSHIPGDRNGVKFFLPKGEIEKKDEAAIVANLGKPVAPFASDSDEVAAGNLGDADPRKTETNFIRRYVRFFGADALSGLRVAVYEHSSCGRDTLKACLSELGAEVLAFGRSAEFIAVDTESVQSLRFLQDELGKMGADLLVSTDGDGDRPLVVLPSGVVPGDLLCAATAIDIGADVVAYPVSCNSSIANLPEFKRQTRTKIGSPFVLDAILKAGVQDRVVGFEANGGFLLGYQAGSLSPLMTRDSFLPIIVAAKRVKSGRRTLATWFSGTHVNVTESRLVKQFPTELSAKVLDYLRHDLDTSAPWIQSKFGKLESFDLTDGVRLRFTDKTLHFRPSGNAPEFRIYAEAPDASAAMLAADDGERWVKGCLANSRAE